MRPCERCRADVADEARFCPFCGAAVAAAAPGDPYLGRVVNGKFLVEELVGRGGMGRVYRARHLTLERPVVLKMLHRGLSGDPQLAERFHREAKAASRLSHPNSIAVLDFGQAEDGTLFMAMEYLAGKDLARVIAEDSPLPPQRVVRIGAQILSALSEAHARGIVHRDLKPENVMVEPRRDEPDFVKVLDFGIAKISEQEAGEPRLTQAGLVCGTPEYMSPEQASGREIDARSDLYSAGVLLYQMATGLLPFDSDTPVGYLTKHLSEPPRPPSARRPGLSVGPALEALVLRALAKDPAGRFASADEMRRALLACEGEGAAAPAGARAGEGRGAAASPPPRRRRAARLAGAAVAAALASAAVLWLRQGRTPALLEAPPAPAPAASSPAAAPAAAPPPASVARDRDRALALYRRAEAKRAEQDPAGAIPLYLAAEAADPTLHQVQKKLAMCYQMKGDLGRAAERYRRYLATDPDDADKVRAILATLR